MLVGRAVKEVPSRQGNKSVEQVMGAGGYDVVRCET